MSPSPTRFRTAATWSLKSAAPERNDEGQIGWRTDRVEATIEGAAGGRARRPFFLRRTPDSEDGEVARSARGASVIMSLPRYVCIHGHCYQPPRENPWLEAVEVQDSAKPYHDWNERITMECYGPNTRSRLLDHQGKIVNL